MFVLFLNFGNQLHEFSLHLKESVAFNCCTFRLETCFCFLHKNKLVSVKFLLKINFTLEQATEAKREKRYGFPLSLTSALDWEGGQSQSPAALPLVKKPGTHSIGGWVGPRDSLDGCGKSRLHRD